MYHPMRVLAITKVFPNAVVPLDEPHIRQQYAALARTPDTEVEVLATIPWFPGLRAFARYSYAGRVASAPRQETIDGLQVFHPRFLQVPKVGVPFSAALYAASLLPAVLRRRSRFDVILSTWAYPDGAAAVALGKLLGLPVVVQVIGSDMNVVAQMPAARFNLGLALPHASRLVAVSEQLGHAAAALGVDRERIDVIPTGVNRELFKVRHRREARRQLGLPEEGKLALFLGRLDRAKGIFELCDAFARLAPQHPDWRLVLVGADETRGAIAERLQGFGDRVLLPGQQPIDLVPSWLAACDVLTLPSYAEGTPNVILEALACGRRVVATSVGGIPDLVRSELQGLLVRPRNVDGLTAALEQALANDYDDHEVSRSEGVLSWPQAAGRLRESLARAVAGL
jgi:teichuronic acid biosynthesis glycosyltransferase TuaC